MCSFCLKMPCGQGEAGRAQPKEGTPPWAEPKVAKAVPSPHFMLLRGVDLGRGHAGQQDLGPWPQTGVWVWKMPGALWVGDAVLFVLQFVSLGEFHVRKLKENILF